MDKILTIQEQAKKMLYYTYTLTSNKHIPSEYNQVRQDILHIADELYLNAVYSNLNKGNKIYIEQVVLNAHALIAFFQILEEQSVFGVNIKNLEHIGKMCDELLIKCEYVNYNI